MGGLDQENILALQEILRPQFEALSQQLADVKGALAGMAESARLEGERRREDIRALYDQDRIRAAEIADLTVRLVSLEHWRAEHAREHSAKIESRRFTVGQLLTGAGVLVVLALWVADKVLGAAK